MGGSSSVAVSTSVRLVQKRPSFRRGGRLLESCAGVVPSHTFGPVFREWVRDRGSNRYQERVTTLDGTLVHACEEPLTPHHGRGDDRRKDAQGSTVEGKRPDAPDER